MKLAVSGKGGVGKTTFSALLIRTLDEMGKQVLAIDADPDANLAAAIGIDNAGTITPISEMEALIYERTEAKPGSIGGDAVILDWEAEVSSARLPVDRGDSSD